MDSEYNKNIIAYNEKKASLTDGWWALFTNGNFVAQAETKYELFKIMDFTIPNYLVHVERDHIVNEIS